MNKESSWEECIETSASLKVSPNKSKAKSSIETAEGRTIFLEETSVKENNANYIFENYYSSVMEMMHSLVLLNGYNVGNHICLGYFLRDVLSNEELYRLFDDCRSKRNSLIYYGKKMDFETAKTGIDNCKKLIGELKLLLEHEARGVRERRLGMS